MKLNCKFGTKQIKIVEVSPKDQVNVLFAKLKIYDKRSKFVYNGISESLASILTFEELNIPDNAHINIINQGIAGIFYKKNNANIIIKFI